MNQQNCQVHPPLRSAAIAHSTLHGTLSCSLTGHLRTVCSPSSLASGGPWRRPVEWSDRPRPCPRLSYVIPMAHRRLGTSAATGRHGFADRRVAGGLCHLPRNDQLPMPLGGWLPKGQGESNVLALFIDIMQVFTTSLLVSLQCNIGNNGLFGSTWTKL